MTVPAGMSTQTPDKSKNWLGIAGLITSLVCGLQLLGLIFGILGLGAAKRGQATNRGMAMFATIWSAVWLALTVAGGVYVAANFDGGRIVFKYGGAAGHDVANVDRAVDRFNASHPGKFIINIGFDGEYYYVAGEPIKAESSNPTINFFVKDGGGHCLEIKNGASSASIAHNGTCEGTPREVLRP